MRSVGKYIGLLIALGAFLPLSYGQSNSVQPSTVQKKASANNLNAAAKEAEANVRSDDELATADAYVKIADGLRAQGDFAKAEQYFEKATAIYNAASKKSTVAAARLAAAERKLAKTQEEQNKLEEAAMNYNRAGSKSKDGITRQLNFNDASRLQSNSFEVQRQYSQNNLDLLKKAPEQNTGVKQELSDAYTQLAETQSKQDDSKGAIASLTKAVVADKDNKANAEITAQKISEALVKNNQVDDAIKLNQELLKSSDANQNTLLKISTYTQLGTLYAQSGKPALAEEHLQKAYETAKSINNTKAGKTALKSLLEYYLQTKQQQKAQSVMLQFLDDMDQMLSKDSSLMDMKAFEQSEQKIRQLEKEKILQNEVIAQSRLSNYLLLAVVAIVALFLVFMIKAYYAIIKKNKQIKLQSLRREMNPHFVFNSLNSVNQFIAENDDRKANTYLNAYSRLMRTIMEHSNQDFVPLSVELDHLNKYLALEHQRFSNQFDYMITVDETIDTYGVLVPNMILQPFLENAIWHGLRYKESKGLLLLSIDRRDNALELSIIDDGIGIEHSLALKTKNQKAYKSLGMQNTQERIALLNSLYKTHIQYTVKDRATEGKSGTTITLNIPIQTRDHED